MAIAGWLLIGVAILVGVAVINNSWEPLFTQFRDAIGGGGSATAGGASGGVSVNPGGGSTPLAQQSRTGGQDVTGYSPAGASAGGSGGGASFGAASPMVNPIVSAAQSQIGKQYQYGAPTSSTLQQFLYDCSSLVQSVFEHAGINFPWRTSQQQAQHVTPVSNPQPGDLVFGSFSSPNDHVGIYQGNGLVISAWDEAHGVISNLASTWRGVWFGRFTG